MRAFGLVLTTLASLSVLSAAPGSAEGVQISQERQSYLEGVWKGISGDKSADKLCSVTAPPPDTTTLSIEFMRSGGMAFADDGTEGATRGAITEATEANGVISLTFGNEVWRLRPENDEVMSRVRSSASLGADVDSMVFKRCQKPADRSAIALSPESISFLAADLPGDEPFFMDERIAAKTGDRCAVQETQYLFFVLVGPAEFRVSRWNSFALADKLAAKSKANLPPLDPVANWRIESARAEGAKYIFLMRDYEDAKAAPETIHVVVKSDGRVEIPQWKRTYVRCTKFQSRS